MKTLYINSIKFNRSLVDGPGVRTVVFFQGCDIHCKGCQNQSTWDITKGTPITTKDLSDVLHKEVINKKITLSGGEPLMQADSLSEFLDYMQDFDIVLYTGHRFEDVPQEILNKLKYIKTGEFREELKTTVKPFVGSTNQEFRRLR